MPDSRKSRPFFDESTNVLLCIATSALASGDCEAFSFVLAELSHRSTGLAIATAEKLRKSAKKSGMVMIPRVEEAFSLFQDFDGNASGEKHVYAVLLYSNESGFGFYIGQTGIDPAERFRQHMNGYKASRHVRAYGKQLLPMFTRRFRSISSDDALRIEAALADALRRNGFWVEGGH